MSCKRVVSELHPERDAASAPPLSRRPRPSGLCGRTVRALMYTMHRAGLPFAMRADNQVLHFHACPLGDRVELTGPLCSEEKSRFIVDPDQCDNTAHPLAKWVSWGHQWHVVLNSDTFVHNAWRLRQHCHALYVAHALLNRPAPYHRLPKELVPLVLSFLSPSPRRLNELLLPVSF